MLTVKELHSKNIPELKEELEANQRALLGVRIEVSNQAVNKTSLIRKLRKQVAKVKTIIRAKEIAGEKVTTPKVENEKENS